MRTKPNPCPRCAQKMKVITREEKKKGAWYSTLKCFSCGYKTPTIWQRHGESVKALSERSIQSFNQIDASR